MHHYDRLVVGFQKKAISKLSASLGTDLKEINHLLMLFGKNFRDKKEIRNWIDDYVCQLSMTEMQSNLTEKQTNYIKQVSFHFMSTGKQ